MSADIISAIPASLSVAALKPAVPCSTPIGAIRIRIPGAHNPPARSRFAARLDLLDWLHLSSLPIENVPRKEGGGLGGFD
jgi:hypothetical protein